MLFIHSILLLECDHSICATCSSLSSCIVPCLGSCTTCNASNECEVP